ncbi:MAG TPA: ankyrin repeat domain-containing protein [Bryobacteraceae bacterium]
MSAHRLPEAVSAALLLYILTNTLLAQPPDTISVEGQAVESHRLTHRAIIHQQLPPRYTTLNVCLQVVVNRSGGVDSARPEYPNMREEKWARDEAITAEESQRFRPFLKDGTPVRVTFEDCVWIVPPVQWASPRVPFPAIRDWGSLRVWLTRTGCYGFCPEYSVEIRGTGEVLFDGKQNVLMLGHHHGRISAAALGDLLAAFRRADYFSLKDEYVAMITDNSTTTTSIEFDGHKKSVKDYVGFAAGMPEIVTELENKIDQLAGTDKWIRETPQSAPSLLAEGWDFQTPESGDLFAHAIQWKAKSVVDLFLQHGAPTAEQLPIALAAAARIGNLALVSRFSRDAGDLPEPTLACILDAAAESGSLPTVRLLIASGAKVNGPYCKGGMSPLIGAALSGNPALVDEILKYHPDINAKGPVGETALSAFLGRSLFQSHARQIVASLIKAGADVNVRSGPDDETPIFHACELPGVAPLLIKAGADLNVRNQWTETPLMSCTDSDDLKALLAAGADPTLRDSLGKTAADEALEAGDKAAAALLEAAAKARKH